MISHASICSFEGKYVRLEIAMFDIYESETLSDEEKEYRMFDVSLDVFPADDEAFYEGDIVVVEHDMEYVSHVLYKDETEKRRRTEELSELKKLLEAKM